jgi:hypothetical protein
MKKFMHFLILFGCLSIIPLALHAQVPPHPNGGGGPGGGNVPVGGGVPIDGGLGFLIFMGSAYAFRKKLNLK